MAMPSRLYILSPSLILSIVLHLPTKEEDCLINICITHWGDKKYVIALVTRKAMYV